MKIKFGVLFLVLAAMIAIGTGIAHLSCIYFGPECYAAQMAPPVIVDSAKAATYLAPLAAVLALILFTILGCYALSAAKLIPRLPFLQFGIYSIATVCIIRGLLGIQLWLRKSEIISESILYAGLVWSIVGMLYLFGYRTMQKGQ